VATRVGKGKGKAVRLQAWTGPGGSRKLRLPYFVTTAQNGGNFSKEQTMLPEDDRMIETCRSVLSVLM